MSVDLSTRYLGFDLAGPLVASASPLTGTLEGLKTSDRTTSTVATRTRSPSASSGASKTSVSRSR